MSSKDWGRVLEVRDSAGRAGRYEAGKGSLARPRRAELLVVAGGSSRGANYRMFFMAFDFLEPQKSPMIADRPNCVQLLTLVRATERSEDQSRASAARDPYHRLLLPTVGKFVPSPRRWRQPEVKTSWLIGSQQADVDNPRGCKGITTAHRNEGIDTTKWRRKTGSKPKYIVEERDGVWVGVEHVLQTDEPVTLVLINKEFAAGTSLPQLGH